MVVLLDDDKLLRKIMVLRKPTCKIWWLDFQGKKNSMYSKYFNIRLNMAKNSSTICKTLRRLGSAVFSEKFPETRVVLLEIYHQTIPPVGASQRIVSWETKKTANLEKMHRSDRDPPQERVRSHLKQRLTLIA